ncbi:MAG: hypothetical protein ACKVWR_20360, partial [Acidimicrobiales bacterium]
AASAGSLIVPSTPPTAPATLARTPAPSAPPSGDGRCEVVPAEPAYGFDPFYEKVCVVDGVPIVAAGVVEDAALRAAADIAHNMLLPRPDLRAQMIANGLRIGVLGRRQQATEMPEYRDLTTRYPGRDWNAARAYGARPGRPLMIAPEENLTCGPADTYPGQSVLTHELGHSVLDLAVAFVDPTFKGRLADAFRQAQGMTVYRRSYAMTDLDEYWAEGVQDYFDASTRGVGDDGGGNGYDSPIATRAELAAADPVLHGLIAEVFTDRRWTPSCP